MAKRKRTKGQQMIYKTLHRKYRAPRTTLKTWAELRCSGSVGIPDANVTSVVLLVLQTW